MRLRRSPLRLCVTCCLVLVAGCGGCDNGFPDLPDVEIASLEVVPSETYAEASAVFELHARARDASGHIVQLPASSVEWSGGVDFDPDQGNPTTVKAPGVSDLTGFVNGVSKVTVVAKVGNKQSEPATIWIVDPSNVSGSRLHIHHVDDAKPTSVLLDGKRQSGAVEDLVANVALRARFDEPFVTGGQQRASVLSPERAMHFEESNPTTPIWSGGDEELKRVDDLMPVEKIEVFLRIGVVDAAAKQDAIHELAIARDIFRSYRVGIELVAVVDFESTTDVVLVDPAVDISVCTTVDAQFGIDLSQQELNVLYVVDMGSSYKGFSCPQAGLAGRVILMNWPASPTTLAHELGHALSLVSPQVPFGGHTGGCFPSDTVSGFEPTNLMWACLDFDKSSRREHISLGQAFRMNMDVTSWITQVVNRPNMVACQCNPYASKPCPRLSTDVNPLNDAGVGDACNPLGGLP